MHAKTSKSSDGRLNTCAQCGEVLRAPTWSEQAGERRVRYLWNCEACGYEFETTIYLAARKSLLMLDTAA